MSVKIRLKRIGMKKQPHYRVVVADSRSPRDGRFIEEIGYYDPRTEPKELKIDLERANYWMSTGAKPSPTVSRIMKIQAEQEQKGIDPVAKRLAEKEAAKQKAANAPDIVREAAPVEEAEVEETTEATEANTEDAAPETPAETETENN